MNVTRVRCRTICLARLLVGVPALAAFAWSAYVVAFWLDSGVDGALIDSAPGGFALLSLLAVWVASRSVMDSWVRAGRKGLLVLGVAGLLAPFAFFVLGATALTGIPDNVLFGLLAGGPLALVGMFDLIARSLVVPVAAHSSDPTGK